MLSSFIHSCFTSQDKVLDITDNLVNDRPWSNDSSLLHLSSVHFRRLDHLGGTILSRTGSASDRLRDHVQSIWGAPHVQASPFAEYGLPVQYTETVTEGTTQKVVVKTRLEPHVVRPAASELLSIFNRSLAARASSGTRLTKSDFTATTRFEILSRMARRLQLVLPLPAAQAVYDDLTFLVNGQPVTPVTEKETARVRFDIAPNESVRLQIAYHSQASIPGK